MNRQARILKIASIILVIAVCLVALSAVTLNLFWALLALFAMLFATIAQAGATLLTSAFTYAMWAACIAISSGRPAERASHGAKVSRGGAYRASLTALRSASEVGGQLSIVVDVQLSCALLGALGIALAPPFVGSRASGLVLGTVPATAFATDPSIVVGVPIVLASWCLFSVCKSLGHRELGRLRMGQRAIALVACTLVLLWIAASRDYEAIVAPRSYKDPYNLQDFIGQTLSGSVVGPFRTRWPSWPDTFAMLLWGYAVLLAAATLNVLYLVMRTPRAARPGNHEG
jgi:hypothetical protein